MLWELPSSHHPHGIPNSAMGTAMRQLVDLFSKGISTIQFERFVRQEIPGAHSFYRRAMRQNEQPVGRIRSAMRVTWYIFLAFLEKLTPVRRVLYGAAIVLFILWWTDGPTSYSFYAFVLLNLLLAMEVADKLVTKNELVVAREIQLSLLPQSPACPAGCDIAAYSEVANSVGGDYYDAIQVRNGSVLYILADVSGKGIPAALYTATVQTALRLFAAEIDQPRELLVRLDAYLRGQLRKAYFLTIVIARVDADGTVTVCRAGHPGALWYRSSDKTVQPIRPQGAAIGLIVPGDASAEKTVRSTLMEEVVVMGHRDALVLLSDGLLEATNMEGGEYGEPRLSGLLKAFPASTAEEWKERILADVLQFRKGADLRDDLTVVVVHRA